MFEDTQFAGTTDQEQSGVLRLPAFSSSTADAPVILTRGRPLIRIGCPNRALNTAARRMAELLDDVETGGWSGTKARTTTLNLASKRRPLWSLSATEPIESGAAHLRSTAEFVAFVAAIIETAPHAEDPVGPGTSLPSREELNVVLRITDVGPLDYSYMED